MCAGRWVVIIYLCSSGNVVKATFEFEGQEGELSFMVREINGAVFTTFVSIY